MGQGLSESAEELLELLLWTADRLALPSMGRLNETLEMWHRRTGWRQQIHRLERNELLTTERRAGDLVCRLTNLGRLAALGGRDPTQRWQRSWDGQWRMVIFDLPVRHQALRQQLLRWLRQNGFGYLQDSVWICPDPAPAIDEALAEFRTDVESLTILTARCCPGYDDAALVQGAWDFARINQRYATHLSQAEGELRRALPGKKGGAELRLRFRQERLAWRTARELDPLLPQQLLPVGYLGQPAWQAHRAVMTRLAKAWAGLSG